MTQRFDTEIRDSREQTGPTRGDTQEEHDGGCQEGRDAVPPEPSPRATQAQRGDAGAHGDDPDAEDRGKYHGRELQVRA